MHRLSSIAVSHFKRARARALWGIALALVAGGALLYALYAGPEQLRLPFLERAIRNPLFSANINREPAAQSSEAFAIEYYVSTRGQDTNPGTQEQPFATLEGARDALRSLRADGKLAGGACIWIRGGVYPIHQSLRLDSRDAGRPDAPIVYQAYPGEEVRLTGGADIPANRFVPVADSAILERLDPSARNNVLQVDLKASGITDLGRAWPRRFKGYAHWLELFFDDQPMTLARWPNKGFAKIARVVDASSNPQARIITYTGDRPSRWTQAPEVYLNGYWYYKWYDEVLQVANIDPAQRQISFAASSQYGLGGPSGGFYYAMNLLEELDSPGEFYVDRGSGLLYFWPPAPLHQQRVTASLLDEAMFVLRDAPYVTLRGLALECSRSIGIVINGGSHDLIERCTIRNLGTDAIIIRDGASHGVVSCTIYSIGRGGISLSGGDRATLTPAGHYALNNDIHAYARLERTYQPAITLDGVGCRAAHNLIYDAPHEAIAFSGNEHIMEFNEIHDVCTETDDAGAIYAGRDWTMRGNVIHYNFFHHIGGGNHVGVQGVYLDDQFSGTLVYGNVFYKNQRAMLIGGGCDNIIQNNLIIDCNQALLLDARGLGWQKDAAQKGGIIMQQLSQVPYRDPLWSSQYPELVNILRDDPGTPKRNVFRNNILVNSANLNIEAQARQSGSIGNNWSTSDDPGFQCYEELRFKLRPDAEAFTRVVGFTDIPFEQIGIQDQ